MKRVISVGLVKPSALESNVIYVSLESQRNGFKITAVSTEEFQYHYHAFDGKVVPHCEKETTIIIVPRKDWFKPYEVFLNSLAEDNNGILNYGRLIKESVKAHSRLEQITELSRLR